MKFFQKINQRQMNADVEQRIAEMEQPGYQFPKRFCLRDYIAVGIVAAVCLLGIIWGYTL